jgi:hypothetical protein
MAKKMRDRITLLCEREYDRMVEEEREERRRQKYLLTAPHIGDKYHARQHDDIMRKVAKAIAASAWHERTTSISWARPLPLEMGWCETLINNDRNELKLLGYFGRSLRWNNWDFEIHPVFDVFCSGVTEWFLSPPEITMDKELLRMFPPKALVGLSHPLQWSPPRT